uniref:Uncharacterized protein n=1 Tax=Mycobacterium sp. (strain KMS) TaxID=189918 RepID=A1UBG6_MYCSK
MLHIQTVLASRPLPFSQRAQPAPHAHQPKYLELGKFAVPEGEPIPPQNTDVRHQSYEPPISYYCTGQPATSPPGTEGRHRLR